VLPPGHVGWHLSGKVSLQENITLLPPPPECLEWDVEENVSHFMRDNWMSNQVFSDRDDIVADCWHHRNRLVDKPWRMMSITLRDWTRGF
jgi:hypothetical protein